VGIDARLLSGTAGGVEQFIIGLGYGLSQLSDGQEEYHFLTYLGADDWIRPYLSGPCRILGFPGMPRGSNVRSLIRNRYPKVYDLVQRYYPVSERWKMQGLLSNGTIERANVDVMHFTHQVAFLTRVPSIYHPHDIQHKHLPHYFSKSKRVMREVLYQMFCRRARLVAVSSSWMKKELIRVYHFSGAKVQVVPLAPPLSAYHKATAEDIRFVKQKLCLPDEFVFYPAQTWPHKNHIALLDALAILRQRFGMNISAVFTGSTCGSTFQDIMRHIRKLGLDSQIRFLGFVKPLDLQCVYQLARCVVIPTKYEAASFPIWEAFLSGVPVACSNVTSLPEQAGNAALFFNPNIPEEIAKAILRLWEDVPLRDILIKLGHQNVAHNSWKRTAQIFRAHYRRIVGKPLSEEDRTLLMAPPLE
jgi:glycosyltransferase involved in cell wall biosynthesis